MQIWTNLQTKWKIWRKNRKLKRLKLSLPVYCKIHGVTKADRQGALAQTRPGDKLQVVHVPLENFPENAYVYSIPLNRVLGYLHTGLADKLLQVFGKNFCLDAVVENRTGGEKTDEFLGCNICIFDATTYMEEEKDFQHLYC